MALSAELLNLLEADAAEHVALRRGDVLLAQARQRDGAAQDMRVIGGFIAGNLFSSDDPERFAGLNAGIRVPTSIDHPGIKN